MVQRLRRLGYGESYIHLDGVPLVGSDQRPVFIEGIPLFAVAPHNLLQNVPIDGVLLTDARRQRIDIRPAMGVQLGSDDLRLVPEGLNSYLLIFVRSGVVSLVQCPPNDLSS